MRPPKIDFKFLFYTLKLSSVDLPTTYILTIQTKLFELQNTFTTPREIRIQELRTEKITIYLLDYRTAVCRTFAFTAAGAT